MRVLSSIKASKDAITKEYVDGNIPTKVSQLTNDSGYSKIFYVYSDILTYTYSQINGLIADGYEIRLKTNEYMGEEYGYTICNMIYYDEYEMYFSFIDYGLTGTFLYSFTENKWYYDEGTLCSKDEMVFYGTSSTAENLQAKSVSCYGYSKLQPGTKIFVKFTNGNSYDGIATLNVNNTGAKDIAVVGNTKTSRYYWSAGEVIGFVYDGTNYVMLGKGTATTTYYGVTKLTDSVSSTSTDTSATPNSVKQAYDLANSKQDILVSGTNIKTVNNQSILGSGNISLEGAPTFELDDILNINSVNDENYIGIKDAIENDELFYIRYYNYDLGKQYHFVPIKCDYAGNSHYFYFMNTDDVNNGEDVYTEVKMQNARGTSVTVTTRYFSKQDKLVSGTNIKTINGNSILGSGDINIASSNGVEFIALEDITFDIDDTNEVFTFICNNASEGSAAYLFEKIMTSLIEEDYSNYSVKLKIGNDIGDLTYWQGETTYPYIIGGAYKRKADVVIMKSLDDWTIITPNSSSGSIDFDAIYPLGSIYVSLDSTDPGILFGGTWEKINGRFLLSTGTPEDNTKDAFGTDLRLPNGSGKYNVTLGSTGGSSVHALTINQIPSHHHSNTIDATDKTGWGGRVKYTSAYSALHDAAYKYRAAGNNYLLYSCDTQNTGGGGLHNNVPPYLAVNMWKKTGLAAAN